MAPKIIIREAAQQGLIDDPTKWINYINARNLTSHTYNEDLAKIIFKTVQEFYPDLENLYEKLKDL